ncbi:MAG TPA: DUF4250 domain-containing protein [Pseudoflavonifractor sp.]|nr:DUF4250 domain-containing protein [Pseudoflavonifractor sp.]
MADNLPLDPVILLSYVNTQLRDFYSSFQDFCDDRGIGEREIGEKLAAIGYRYSKEHNRFE